MSTSTKTLSSEPWAGGNDKDLVDHFGHIEPLLPEFVHEAQRVVAGHDSTDLPATRVLLDILGLTPGDVQV